MKLNKTVMDGVYLIDNYCKIDERGKFVKTFNDETFQTCGKEFLIKESYYSVSDKNVIRGMHFQLPNYEHNKLVYVAKGAVCDVVLDLRKNSKTYTEFLRVDLNDDNLKGIYIPKGCAHGFKSLMDGTLTVYSVDSVYNSDFDTGIHFDSFGFDWETETPIVSNRDNKLIHMNKFLKNNPF